MSAQVLRQELQLQHLAGVPILAMKGFATERIDHMDTQKALRGDHYVPPNPCEKEGYSSAVEGGRSVCETPVGSRTV